jgi:hypothetical protein
VTPKRMAILRRRDARKEGGLSTSCDTFSVRRAYMLLALRRRHRNVSRPLFPKALDTLTRTNAGSICRIVQ